MVLFVIRSIVWLKGSNNLVLLIANHFL